MYSVSLSSSPSGLPSEVMVKDVSSLEEVSSMLFSVTKMLSASSAGEWLPHLQNEGQSSPRCRSPPWSATLTGRSLSVLPEQPLQSAPWPWCRGECVFPVRPPRLSARARHCRVHTTAVCTPLPCAGHSVLQPARRTSLTSSAEGKTSTECLASLVRNVPKRLSAPPSA